MIQVWSHEMARATHDVDFLSRMKNDLDGIARALKIICETAPEIDDGLHFSSDTIRLERIQEQEGYEGVRAFLIAQLAQAKIPIQIDIGFGDPVVPPPSNINYPTLLDFPAPKITGYPRESAIAEKIHAMVRFGVLNSRMKDFYDIWLLARSFEFDGDVLHTAIKKTFVANETDLNSDIDDLLKNLKSDSEKQKQWSAFLRRIRVTVTPPRFSNVISSIEKFLLPLLENHSGQKPRSLRWKAAGPWKARRS